MYLKKLDLFGVNYKTRLSDWETEQKSVFGGIVTLILYSMSLAYFIYVCVQWSDNRILPRTTQTNRLEKYSEADFTNDRLFEFAFWKYSEHLVDPLQEQNNIIMPLAVPTNNGVATDIFSLLGNNELTLQHSKIITYESLQLVMNSEYNPKLKPVTEMLIIFTRCQSQYLKQGQSCATEEQISAFFNQGVPYISLWIYLRQFNPSSKLFESVKKQIYMPLTESSCLHQQIMFRQMHVVVDDGFLFEATTKSTVMNDVSILQSNVPVSYIRPMFKLDSYMMLILRLDPIETYLQVTFPKVGEILASVGSIVSILLTAKYLVIIFNEHVMDKELIDEVILMYCPKWENLIKQFRINKNQINMSLQRNQYKDLKERAKEKLQLTNIIYELSRLQFMIQHLHGKQLLQQSHQMGLEINQQQLQRSVSLDNIELVQNHHINQIMELNDFNILSKPKPIVFKSNGPTKISQEPQRFINLNNSKSFKIV